MDEWGQREKVQSQQYQLRLNPYEEALQTSFKSLLMVESQALQPDSIKIHGMLEDQTKRSTTSSLETSHYLFFDHSEDSSDHFLCTVPAQSSLTAHPTQTLLHLSHLEYSRILCHNNVPASQVQILSKSFTKAKRTFRRQIAKERFQRHKEDTQIEVKTEAKMDEPLTEQQQTETREEAEKRKKRLSAQISRDRRKRYVRNLESENRELRRDLGLVDCQKKRLIAELQHLKKNLQQLKYTPHQGSPAFTKKEGGSDTCAMWY